MPDIEKIEKALKEYKVQKEEADLILNSHSSIYHKNKRVERALKLATIINKMDEILEDNIKTELIEWCACCKTGQRDRDCKRFGKENSDNSLEEKILGLSKIRYMDIAKPRINKDGLITAGIYWNEKGKYKCSCTNIKWLPNDIDISKTYCHCCAGHFKYHFQNALGVALKTKEITSSALVSKGLSPCEFVYEIVSK